MRMRNGVLVALCVGLIMGCAARQHSLEPELSYALDAARNPQEVAYVGNNPELAMLFDALARRTPSAFRGVKMSSIADVMQDCDPADGTLASHIAPTLHGIEVTVEASCFAGNTYVMSKRSTTVALTTATVPDPDVGLSAEELQERYPRMEYEKLRSHKHKDAWFAPFAGVYHLRYARPLSVVLSAEKFGIETDFVRAEQRVAVTFRQRYDMQLEGNDFTEASAIYAGIVDDYGDGNHLVTPWEYAKFEEDILRLAAIHLGLLADAEVRRMLTEQGVRVNEATQWVERVRALQETSLVVQFPPPDTDAPEDLSRSF
ncbi:MAG: hypothetical protein Q7T01_02950 [bacterium]|nr:hypothetical protein [bacterium]